MIFNLDYFDIQKAQLLINNTVADPVVLFNRNQVVVRSVQPVSFSSGAFVTGTQSAFIFQDNLNLDDGQKRPMYFGELYVNAYVQVSPTSAVNTIAINLLVGSGFTGGVNNLINGALPTGAPVGTKVFDLNVGTFFQGLELIQNGGTLSNIVCRVFFFGIRVNFDGL